MTIETLQKTPAETMCAHLISMVDRDFHVSAVSCPNNTVEIPLWENTRFLVTITREDPIVGFLTVDVEMQQRREVDGALTEWELLAGRRQVTSRHPIEGFVDAERDLRSYLSAKLMTEKMTHLIR